MEAKEDIITLVCSEEDFQFLTEDFESIALGLCEQFDFDPNIEMFIEVDKDCMPGEILMFLNGEPYTIIPIIDEEDLPKVKKETRVLH